MAIHPHVKFLRLNQTPAEGLLWGQLRKKRIADLRFRRQYRIGRYIVDFVCLPARLVVEVDGDSHDQTVARDKARTAWLVSQNFRVIRFSNREVTENLEGVVRTIENEVADAVPARRPSP